MLHFASSAGTGLNSALSGLVDGNEGGSVKKRKTKSRNGCARCKSKRVSSPLFVSVLSPVKLAPSHILACHVPFDPSRTPI
jgi:hypothetical protein